MIFCKLVKEKNSQGGFTLIELLVALAIASVIMAGIAISVYQMFSVQASTTNRMYAVRQVQNVGYWISRDAQAAQSVSYLDDEETPEFEFLIINWVGWNGYEYEKRYIIDDNGNMYRDAYEVDESAEKILVGEMLIAEDIKNDETDLEYVIKDDPDNIPNSGDESHLYRLTVTVEVGSFGQARETRIYEVIPRFGL